MNLLARILAYVVFPFVWLARRRHLRLAAARAAAARETFVGEPSFDTLADLCRDVHAEWTRGDGTVARFYSDGYGLRHTWWDERTLVQLSRDFGERLQTHRERQQARRVIEARRARIGGDA